MVMNRYAAKFCTAFNIQSVPLCLLDVHRAKSIGGFSLYMCIGECRPVYYTFPLHHSVICYKDI